MKNKTNHIHDWKFLKYLNPKEQKLTNKQIEVVCRICGATGYTTFKELNELKGEDE